MLKQLRQNIIHTLWKNYCQNTLQMKMIETALQKKGVNQLILDHFAIIDLPSPQSGIPVLHDLFATLGFVEQGKDYLADKQNDFLWMAEADSTELIAGEVLPQVVVADFRLTEMPLSVRHIIEKYAAKTKSNPLPHIQYLIEKKEPGCIDKIHDIITNYLLGRDWPLPTTKEFYTVKEFNELLAWVLVFGRRPNHFTLSIHLLDIFSDLRAFHCFIENDLQLSLNQEGGSDIKGGLQTGIAQGSTMGIIEKIMLQDGLIEIPTGFVEFVWRYPQNSTSKKPELWTDYFTGFIAKHADRVIESLYVNE